MAVQFYLPRSESALVVWFANWAAKVQVHGAALGVSALEKAQALVDAANVAVVVNTLALYKAFVAEWVGFKDLVLYAPLEAGMPAVPVPPAAPAFDAASLAAILKRTRALNERMRSHPQYTTAIGQDLNIIGPAVAESTRPTRVKAVPLPGSHVRVSYNKGTQKGVVVSSRRGAETGFIMLAIDTNTPFVDTRDPLVAGQPETRTYRLQLYDGDNPVGGYSDEVSVVTLP